MDDDNIVEKKEEKFVATELLREKIRYYALQHRDKLRAQNMDALRFGLGEIKEKIDELSHLTEKDVCGLAARIKRRKCATEEDMYRLSHAFLQDMQNIVAFANTSGALQVIIKELTGKVTSRQIAALECLCNLSLGESFVCDKIANLAGSYLVTCVHIQEKRVQRTSIWTLANLVATGSKTAKILLKMQLVSLLWYFYVTPEEEELAEDAAICLQIIAVTQMWSKEDQIFIYKHLNEKNPTTTAAAYHLQLIFHFNILKLNIEETQFNYLLNFALRNICETKEFGTQTERLSIIYGIRILSNLLFLKENSYNILNEQLILTWQMNISQLFNKLFNFKCKFLTNEILYFQMEEQAHNLLKSIEICNDFGAVGDENVNVANKTEENMIF